MLPPLKKLDIPPGTHACGTLDSERRHGMKKFEIDKGLDLALAGAPKQQIDPDRKKVEHVAVVGPDYVGMKPTILVEPGQHVLAGEPLFEDKKNPGVKFTAPGAGTVEEICRGEKRAFRAVVLRLDADGDASAPFDSFQPDELQSLCPNRVRQILVDSGLWTSFRTRPFSRIPTLDSVPASIFVTAMDTNPGAPNPVVVIGEIPDRFLNGLKVISRFGVKIWLCKAPDGIDIPGDDIESVESAIFSGPHPAGLAGTHIHYLDPVGNGKVVWTIGYQDVMAIGSLFTTGRWPTERVVALSGPKVASPRLIRVPVGASLSELTAGELTGSEVRVISGSVLCGRAAEGNGLDFLGPYVNQVSVIADENPRELFGWTMPGWRKFSVARTVASRWLPRWPYKMTTALHGGKRAVFPNPAFSEIQPLDLMPEILFKALEVGDIESAEELGVLELDEEDVALCTLVDFGKNDYTQTLRTMLNTIMKEEA